MFFENKDLNLKFLGVMELSQKNIDVYNPGRSFNAISLRLESDAVITAGEKTYELKEKSVCFVPAKLDYSRKASKDKLIAVHFDIKNADIRYIDYFYPKNPAVFEALFNKILAYWNKKESDCTYRCTAILYEILAECCLQKYREACAESKIESSVKYIHRHYRDSDLSINKIAEKSYISEVYFRKLFKEEYGISPQKYIINLRIEYAVNLLSAGYFSLKEVALLSGYSDYKYFSVQFKKIIGQSPNEYIKKTASQLK